MSLDVKVALLAESPPDERDHLVDELSGVRHRDGQGEFVGSAVEVVAAALSDPDRYCFAVLADDAVCGLGVLHVGGAPAEVLDELGVSDPGAVLLFRGFLVDARVQGQGIGSRACRLLPALADRIAAFRDTTPYAAIVLTVNERNPGAIAAYVKAGYADRGRYLGGDAGPQRIMVCTL